jgi:uncharacterized membrane protein
MMIDFAIVVVALLITAALMAGMMRGMDVFGSDSFRDNFASISMFIFGCAFIILLALGSIALIASRHDIEHAERTETSEGR